MQGCRTLFWMIFVSFGWPEGGGGTPSGTTFWGQAVAADPQAAERWFLVRFLMDLGLHFGSPGDSFAVMFGDVFRCFLVAVLGSLLHGFLAPFGEVFGVLFVVFS